MNMKHREPWLNQPSGQKLKRATEKQHKGSIDLQQNTLREIHNKILSAVALIHFREQLAVGPNKGGWCQ